jgi:hypothetical protein
MKLTKQAKPSFLSHYLVLKDLIDGIDVRKYPDTIHYNTSRIENIKNDLSNKGILFDEDAKASSRFSYYKPYIIIRTKDNLELAKEILNQYETKKVLEFLENHNEVNREN